MKTPLWIVMLLLIAPLEMAAARPPQSAPAVDQQQEDSLAAAARKAREQKKSEGKPAKVWDNDNLPANGVISVVGQVPAPATSDAAPQGDQANAKPAAQANAPTLSKDQQAALQADLESAKKDIDGLKADLDVLQRKYSLDQQSYYAKPDYASDKAGMAALNDEKDQLDAKQQELADAQKRVDDLQAQLSSSGNPGAQDSK